MKLNELAVVSPTKQAAKVFESYFGNSIKFEHVSPVQARNMLKRVRTLIAEHRRTPEFHRSEQNPNYLKLVVMEQALTARIREDGQPNPAPQTGTQQKQSGASGQQTSAQAAGLSAAMIQQKRKQKQDELKIAQQQVADLQKEIANPTMAETRRARRLREASEIQQAQVVLASQDMVDQVQKMIEQVTSMQFKDLPALCDQIKNEIGVDQSAQFNTDASAALGGLVQNLQASKQQLESALGVVTGQAPVVPGQDMTAPDMGMPAGETGAEEIPAELPAPEEEEIPGAEPTSLGRERR
jgi:hypothetical protein